MAKIKTFKDLANGKKLDYSVLDLERLTNKFEEFFESDAFNNDYSFVSFNNSQIDLFEISLEGFTEKFIEFKERDKPFITIDNEKELYSTKEDGYTAINYQMTNVLPQVFSDTSFVMAGV